MNPLYMGLYTNLLDTSLHFLQAFAEKAETGEEFSEEEALKKFLDVSISLHKQLKAIDDLEEKDPKTKSKLRLQKLLQEKREKKTEENGSETKVSEQKSLTDEEINRLVEGMSKEEKKTAPRKKKKSKKSNSPPTKLKSNFSFPLSPLNEEQVTGLKTDITSIKNQKLTNFAFDLLKESSLFQEEARVERWKTTDIQQIRSFKDKDKNDPNGGILYRYKDLSDEEIVDQRIRHYLPGTALLLKQPYRDVYSKTDDKGVKFMAQLTYKDRVYDGILGMGVSQTNKVFHKYLENFSPWDKRKEKIQQYPINAIVDDIEEVWKSEREYSVEVSQEGVMTFKYTQDHYIRIFPENRELFQELIASDC